MTDDIFDDEIQSTDSDEKLDDLLKGIEENRSHFSGMLNDISTFRKQVDTLLPEKMDYKKKFLFEERMKTVTSIIGMELDIRKSLENSYKTEIELRRKIAAGEDEITDKSQRIEMMAEALSKLSGRGNRIHLNVTEEEMKDELEP